MQAFCEPLTVAEAAFEPPQQMPELTAVVATAVARPPRLPATVLLAFGNLPSGDER